MSYLWHSTWGAFYFLVINGHAGTYSYLPFELRKQLTADPGGRAV